MNDAEQDRQPSPLTSIPSPAAGAGSGDLSTTSDDPAELRTLLDRARERLIFYESYDRIIGENIRRTGELMLDSIAVREQATAQAERADHAQAQLEAQIAANQREQQTLTQSLGDELDVLQSALDRLRHRLDSAPSGRDPRPTTDQQGPVSPASPDSATPDDPGMEDAAGAVQSGIAPPPSPSVVAGEPVLIDVIAQGVSTAATALSLQRFLGELDAVIGVEAREFAEGILRLQVTANRSLSGADLAAWTDGPGWKVSQEQPRILEIELAPNAA